MRPRSRALVPALLCGLCALAPNAAFSARKPAPPPASTVQPSTTSPPSRWRRLAGRFSRRNAAIDAPAPDPGRRLPNETFWDRMADRVSRFSGSWPFLGLLNLEIVAAPFVGQHLGLKEVFSVEFQNYLISVVTVNVGTFLLMSASRSEARMQTRSQATYEVDVRTERRLRLVDEKADVLHLDAADLRSRVEQLHLDLAELGRKLDLALASRPPAPPPAAEAGSRADP